MLNTTPNHCSGQRIFFFTDRPTHLSLPLFAGKVSAGTPFPNDDRIEKSLDLNKLLVRKPVSTFFFRAEGDSMIAAGIHPNDILIVDRLIEPDHGKIVICALNGEFYVKRLKRCAGQWILGSENPAYPYVVVNEKLQKVIWGVVTYAIHKV